MTSPAERALDARERLGLSGKGPLPDILGLIETVAGIPVVVEQLGDDGIAGAYAVRRGVPFILVNGSSAIVRGRFTIAHEFGHHLLQHGLSVDRVITLAGGQPVKEVQANAFAAEFLLPLEALEVWLRPRKYPPVDLPLVVDLAHTFRVSALVALYRLSAASRVDTRTANKIEKAIERNEHRSVRLPPRPLLPESFGDASKRSRRLPSEAEYLLLSALGAGLLSERDVAAKLRLGPQEVRQRAQRIASEQSEDI